MRKEVFGTCELYLGDCMEFMAALPDKAFDLAIVDPPYGINIARKISGSGKSKKTRGETVCIKSWKPGKSEAWDKEAPPIEYFDELLRVSEYQIIWGGNYFMDKIRRASKCWIGLVKTYVPDSFSMSNIEFAYSNLNAVSKYFIQDTKCGNIGFIQTKETRIHPTQKPAALYKWLLQKYAKPRWRVLDTHGGSFPSAAAAYELGLTYAGIEIDKDYFEAAVKRMQDLSSQPFLIPPAQKEAEQLFA